MRKVLIYGSKTFGQIVRNLTMQLGMNFAGYIDDIATQGPDVAGCFDEIRTHYSPNEYEIVNAIGYLHLEERWRIQQKIKESGYISPTLIHPTAYIDPSASIEEGAIIMAQAVVDYKAYVSTLAVIWPGVVINHEARIGFNVFLSPNVTVCGCARIGEHTFVGAGAVVVDHRQVEPGSFIKAGSVYSK